MAISDSHRFYSNEIVLQPVFAPQKEKHGYQYFSQIFQNNTFFKIELWEPKFDAKKRGNFY